ncbi:hypothetical protein [Methylocystis echinoides]|uniref:hypothetical protein n=1 Tax=Methylocystis echinoides TaxID=29468 RepID=UPI002492CDC9|nr:hypothetical protein [Methylocystis echinoides]
MQRNEFLPTACVIETLHQLGFVALGYSWSNRRSMVAEFRISGATISAKSSAVSAYIKNARNFLANQFDAEQGKFEDIHLN